MGRQWIAVDSGLPRHPKLRKLANALGIERRSAMGLLVDLWSWASEFAPDGSLVRFEDDDIADGVSWEGDPSILVRSLTRTGFLDDDRTIHDWQEYGGKLHSEREKNKARIKEWREKKKQETDDVTVTEQLPNDYRTITERDRRRGEERREEEMRGDENNNNHDSKVTDAERHASAPSSPLEEVDPLFEMVPTKDGKLFEIRQSLISKWREVFPNVNVEQEVRHAMAWMDAKPANRKTNRGMGAFFVNWLGRAKADLNRKDGNGTGQSGRYSKDRRAPNPNERDLSDLDERSW